MSEHLCLVNAVAEHNANVLVHRALGGTPGGAGRAGRYEHYVVARNPWTEQVLVGGFGEQGCVMLWCSDSSQVQVLPGYGTAPLWIE